MLLELLGLAGIGMYLYDKYVEDNKEHNNRTRVNRDYKRYNEINRVLFGRYITSPYDTEYFEFNCITDKIPASNSIRQAIMVSARQNPPVQLRASCSICECGDGTFQHRWMVCCGNSRDIVFKRELVYAIYGEYLKGRVMTQ